MANILAIDDNEEILKLLKRILTKNGYNVSCLSRVDTNNLDELKGYDLILLDVMLENQSGFDICKLIRSEILTPIVFLTAKTQEEDLVKGFEVGGDDYIKKPFSAKELISRVQAHIRREERKEESGQVLNIKEISIYPDEKAVYVRGENLNLTNKEFELLLLLATNPNKIFSVGDIYDRIYDFDSDSLLTGISEFVYTLRKKFAKYNVNPIKTKRGMGYQWNDEQ